MSGARTRNNSHPVEPLLYDRKTTAKLLSISIRSVDYMVQTRKLAHRRIGSRVLIPASQVRRIADNRCPYTAPPEE